jgi:hypothetical protein
MYIDPGDYLPLMGVSMLAITTGFAIAGAWAMGRYRGLRDAQKLRDEELDSRARLERMERSLEAVSEEIERLGEVQRFALKVIADKVSDAEPQEPIRLPHGRVITPH